jgi:DNA-binding transcriptional MerR regulator
MLSVSQLARRVRLSRTAVLYYEKCGLLRPALRTAASYRLYGEREAKLLEQICFYRSIGVSMRDIARMLATPQTKPTALLKQRLRELEEEIGQLRAHQLLILKLLRRKDIGRTKAMTKDKWVGIMKAAGFSEADMRRWHRTFERSSPQDHEEFLRFLHIPEAEIKSIREWSVKAE